MQPVIARKPRRYVPGRRLLTALPLLVLPVLLAADLASLALVRMSVPDDAGEAARAGVIATQFDRSATTQTAGVAFQAANEVAALHRMDLDRESFLVSADGSVRLTARRDAPTLLFKRLPWLRDHTEATATVTAVRPTW